MKGQPFIDLVQEAARAAEMADDDDENEEDVSAWSLYIFLSTLTPISLHLAPAELSFLTWLPVNVRMKWI